MFTNYSLLIYAVYSVVNSLYFSLIVSLQLSSFIAICSSPCLQLLRHWFLAEYYCFDFKYNYYHLTRRSVDLYNEGTCTRHFHKFAALL